MEKGVITPTRSAYSLAFPPPQSSPIHNSPPTPQLGLELCTPFAHYPHQPLLPCPSHPSSSSPSYPLHTTVSACSFLPRSIYSFPPPPLSTSFTTFFILQTLISYYVIVELELSFSSNGNLLNKNQLLAKR